MPPLPLVHNIQPSIPSLTSTDSIPNKDEDVDTEKTEHVKKNKMNNHSPDNPPTHTAVVPVPQQPQDVLLSHGEMVDESSWDTRSKTLTPTMTTTTTTTRNIHHDDTMAQTTTQEDPHEKQDQESPQEQQQLQQEKLQKLQEPYRFQFEGFAIWLELEQFPLDEYYNHDDEFIPTIPNGDCSRNSNGGGDLSYILQLIANENGLLPIPRPHVTVLYGMKHLTQREVKRIFNQEFKHLFYRSNCEQQQQQDNNNNDDGTCSPTKCHDGEDHVTANTTAHVKSSFPRGWPAPLQVEGSLFDICFDGVDGEVMDMAWLEISYANSPTHEKMIRTIYNLFHTNTTHTIPNNDHDNNLTQQNAQSSFKTRNDNDEIITSLPPSSLPALTWKPHLSLAYDNPKTAVLSQETLNKLLVRFPSLFRERKVVAISLWDMNGTMDQWTCLDRFHV